MPCNYKSRPPPYPHLHDFQANKIRSHIRGQIFQNASLSAGLQLLVYILWVRQRETSQQHEHSHERLSEIRAPFLEARVTVVLNRWGETRGAVLVTLQFSSINE